MSTVHENLTREEARTRARLLADLSYHVELDLTGDDHTFESRTTVRFTCRAPGATTHIDLTAATVHDVILNGRPLDPGLIAPTRVTLAGLEAENELEIRATMTYSREGRGMHHFRDPTDGHAYLHTQCEPFDAHLVFAAFDQPDLKATYVFEVDAPAEWVVVSNAPVAEQPADGQAGRWVFEPTDRISPYLTAIVAGPYASFHAQHGEIPLGLYARRSLQDHLDVEELFDLTRQGLDWFGEAFDFPYPFRKYDQLFVPEFSSGAMENPGCITFNELYVFRSKVTDSSRERRAETLLHEMAHMWFGDLVTMRWFDDLWLNESFATFMSVLCQTSATRFRDAWVTFLDAEKTWAKYQDQLPTTHPIVADLDDVEAVHQNFDGITYAKGASVLRQLVAWVGQDEFLEGCRQYFRKHAWDNAELADFMGALEDASGRDLDSWSSEWLQTTGLNTLRVSYELDDDGRFTRFDIEQEASNEHPTIRRHRIAVGVYDEVDGALERTRRVELDIEGPRTSVSELVGQPSGAFLLVNDDDLTFAKTRIDNRSMAVLTERLSQVTDPFPRALVWNAAWDMVRDGELPARLFVELMLNNVAGESEVGVLQRLQARALAAVERFGDPDNRESILARMAEHAREMLEQAAKGGDHQLAWARHWAACARDPHQRHDVNRVLSGDLTFEGLSIDTDLRWHLVRSLAHAGEVGDDVIDDELRRDATDLGERHAVGARASRPDGSAKEEAWERLFNDGEMSSTVAREIMRGFTKLDQPDVIRPFVERYFDGLDEVWQKRSVEWAIEFAEDMFPHPAADEQLLSRLTRHLDNDVPAPIRRVLLEQRDVLERTLRGRAVDAAAS